MENELKKYNPRKILGFWEAQALATLTSKNYPTSFKAISELINDDNADIEIKRASKILFWGKLSSPILKIWEVLCTYVFSFCMVFDFIR